MASHCIPAFCASDVVPLSAWDKAMQQPHRRIGMVLKDVAQGCKTPSLESGPSTVLQWQPAGAVQALGAHLGGSDDVGQGQEEGVHGSAHQRSAICSKG